MEKKVIGCTICNEEDKVLSLIEQLEPKLGPSSHSTVFDIL